MTLDQVLAKPNQTLPGHLQDCLYICDALLRRREASLRRLCELNSWDWEEVRRLARWAVWFHDIGKSSEEWQTYIRTGKGRITHSLVSFAIGLMTLRLNPGRFEPTPPFAALLAILAHHMQLYDGAFREERYRRRVHLPVSAIQEHQRTFETLEPGVCQADWAAPVIALEKVGSAVERFKEGVHQADTRFKILYSFFLSVLKASDETASRELPESEEALLEAWLTEAHLSALSGRYPLYDPEPLTILSFVEQPNAMQRQLLACDASRVILNAGCGEGKTAAALLFWQKWLRRGDVDRLIFTLPTKFTANNLYRDLTEKYGIPRELVGITHGDSEVFLREMGGEEEGDAALREQVFENSFFSRPITLATVDHLLMSLYHGYRYADRAFSHVSTAMIVFDEVHYYEGTTLEAIAESMKLLTSLGIPHLIMTATIPTAIRERLNRLSAGEGYHFLRAGAEIPGSSKAKRPFCVRRLIAPLLDEDAEVSAEVLDRVAEQRECRQILFVNQVARAKRLYQVLRDEGVGENVVCYHAGFISRDRQRKERLIRALFTPVSHRNSDDRRLLEKEGYADVDACVLVSTQISELSLDISADRMISEIAPVDSLVQRGGRLHRNGWYPTDPCGNPGCVGRMLSEGHEFCFYLAPPYETDRANRPYDTGLLERSWHAIGEEYTFQSGCDWVDVVYPQCNTLLHPALEQAIRNDLVFGKRPQENYARTGEEEGRVVIRQQTYQTFDVVPLQFADIVEEDYRQYKTHHLSISAGAFWAVQQQDRIYTRQARLHLTNRRNQPRSIEIPFLVINADYSFEVGLIPGEAGVANLL